MCRDVDNDGWVDLLTTEIVHWDVGANSDPSELLFNLGDPAIRFERPGNEATGLTREGSMWELVRELGEAHERAYVDWLERAIKRVRQLP